MSEAEAAELSEAIEAKRAIPAIQKPVQTALGFSATIRASMERTPPLGLLRGMPPALASRFTLAEQAVLAVVAAEHMKHGRCTLVLDHIAALAGVCRKTVKNALREAQRLGLVRIEERRLSAWRNAAERGHHHLAGVARLAADAAEGGGVQIRDPPRIQEDKKGRSAQRNRTWAAKGQGSGGDAPQREASRADNLSHCNSTKGMKPIATLSERR